MSKRGEVFYFILGIFHVSVELWGVTTKSFFHERVTRSLFIEKLKVWETEYQKGLQNRKKSDIGQSSYSQIIQTSNHKIYLSQRQNRHKEACYVRFQMGIP